MHRSGNLIIVVRIIDGSLMFLIECIPVIKLVILFQSQVSITQSFSIVLHLQVHTGQQGIGSSQIRMNGCHRLCRQSHLNGFLHILKNEIIHILNGNLRVRSINLRTRNEGYTALLGSRCRIIRIGVIIDQHIIAKRTYHLGIRYHLVPFGICRLRRRRHILNNQITAGNGSIKHVISSFVGIIQHNTVGRFVPHVVGTAQARRVHLRIGQIYIIQQIQGIGHRSSADGILIAQQGLKIGQRGRNLVPLRRYIQIIIA